MQFGIKNEINFAKFLDHKKISQLPDQYQKLILTLFKNADINSKIDCWKSKRNEKADIKIKINSEVKGISIKTGHNCSIHQEKNISIYNFFTKIGLETEIIKYLQKYMDGYIEGTRVDAITYIKSNKEEIEKLCEALNDYYIKANLIIRFIFMGTEHQNYDCDALIYGNPNNFLWATKSEILKYLMEYNTPKIDRITFSALSIKSYDRNLRNNPKRREKEKEIQVKWYTIENDLKIITKVREEKT